MAKLKIKKDRCKGCYLCVVNCPNGLIKVSPELNVKGVKAVYFSGAPERKGSKAERSGRCTGCAMCVAVCPDGVIEVYK